ncbi:MAG: VanZ family protein [Chloroflexi bacterium]|nr:VanZ family protein [Chloroflexota bacterium]
MSNFRELFYRWGPAILVMAVIFFSSSKPGNDLPNFGTIDFEVKKFGHVIGYGLLALSYWRGLRFDKKYIWLAWVLAIAYALTDEFHQSFVAGRHPSMVDVFLFDGGGAMLALWIGRHRLGSKI